MKWVATVCMTLLCSAATGQSGKAFVKEAEDLRKQQRFEEALEKYDLAISVDPRLLKAYQGRAEVHEALGHKAAGARDRRRVAELDPAEPAHSAAAAQAFLDIDSAATALALCEQALRVNPKHMAALQTKVRACLALNDLECASRSADAALALKATTDTHYLHGLVRAATGDLRTAEADLDKVLEWNSLYEPAYVALAEVQLGLHEQYSGTTMRMRALDKAIERCSRALELNPGSTDALFTRSKAHALQKEYSKAIDDVSRCLALGRSDRAVYLQRARYYHGFGQHQNAVNDLNRVILDTPGDTEALLLRAECREANLDLDGALRDLDMAQRLLEGDGRLGIEQRRTMEATRARIAQQLFELNRESDPPRITVTDPFRRGDAAQVSASLDHVKVAGHVRDKSLLKAITVNGHPADFTRDERDPEFIVSIPLGHDDAEIVVQAVDVYDNLSTEALRVERTEGMPPAILITSPKPSAEREVVVPAGKDDLFVEGRVTDASLIRLIALNGIHASYAPDRQDPDFGVKLDIKDRDRITVRAEDRHGNAAEVVYTLVRKAEPVAAKPAAAPASGGAAGITWLVRIENTSYRNFPAVAGVPDPSRIEKAFAGYNVTRTISKKNLTKEQLDRFFNVELRDLVRTNKVNTVLVWYSGHGKTVSGKSYWIPVDAGKDDIYSYYNYGALKAQMQNYSESVTNTVVVSDAATGGSSFYDLTR